jgi:hypothetical protein
MMLRRAVVIRGLPILLGMLALLLPVGKLLSLRADRERVRLFEYIDSPFGDPDFDITWDTPSPRAVALVTIDSIGRITWSERSPHRNIAAHAYSLAERRRFEDAFSQHVKELKADSLPLLAELKVDPRARYDEWIHAVEFLRSAGVTFVKRSRFGERPLLTDSLFDANTRRLPPYHSRRTMPRPFPIYIDGSPNYWSAHHPRRAYELPPCDTTGSIGAALLDFFNPSPCRDTRAPIIVY